jgi:hypothetical protein
MNYLWLGNATCSLVRTIGSDTEAKQMGYEVGMQRQILDLLQLFRERVPDKETNARVIELIADRANWPGAHDLFDLIRDRLLVATGDAGRPRVAEDRIDRTRVAQYAFEELCLKAIFNETDTKYPFDTCSPFWVTGCAIQLARKLLIPMDSVLAIIAPED